jgi:probable HAF family extracellular repeat protein
MNTRIVAISICSLGLTGAAIAQTQAPQVTLVTLPLPAGASGASPVAIDAAGNVLGNAVIGSRSEVVEWVGGKTPVVFPRLPADQGTNKGYYAVAINKAGAVIGASRTPGTGPQPSQGVYWDAGRHPTAVPQSIDLTGLSDGSALVGAVDTSDPTAALWSGPAGQPSILPYYAGLFCTNPVQSLCTSTGGPVSPNGKYAIDYGWAGDNHESYTSLFVNGAAAGNFGGYGIDVAQITDGQVMVGTDDTRIPSTITIWNVRHAFRWEAGIFTDLGSLPGAPAGTAFESSAKAMNSSGVVVGSSQAEPGSLISHAVMWINDQIIDLNTLLAPQLPAGMIATDAYAINDSGEYLVAAQNFDTGASAGYLAKPLTPTHTTVSSNINPSTYGQQIHLVAKVTPDSGPVPTTGSVSWYDNGALVGTARMTTIGTSSWEPSTWTAGVHNVTAKFPAAGGVASSTSPVFKQTVNAASTRTTVSATPSPASHGQSVKLTATVVPTSGTIAGTVTFKSGSTVLGTGTLDARTKQTSLTTSFAKAGSYAITASFAGSQNFTASSSAALTLTVK